jgi:hypothetical protein
VCAESKQSDSQTMLLQWHRPTAQGAEWETGEWRNAEWRNAEWRNGGGAWTEALYAMTVNERCSN